MLYKEGGPHKFHGGNFDYIIVDELEVDKSLEDGWFLTTTEAKEAGEPKDNTPPTRDEMEAKAKELEIRFPANIKDETLLSKINKFLLG